MNINTATAKRTSPLDLQKMARSERAKPRREDSVARRARRSLRKWQSADGFLCTSGNIYSGHIVIEGLTG